MIYKTGFILYDIKDKSLTTNTIELFRQCKMECDCLVVGIFSDEFLAKMSLTDQKDEFENKKDLLLALDEIDKVVQIDGSHALLSDLWMTVQFDLYFSGGTHGSGSREDFKFLESKGVKIRFLFERAQFDMNPLQVALQQAIGEKKIVLFGTGVYFDKYMISLGTLFPPLFAIDNNDLKWGTEKSGIMIKNPLEVFEVESPENIFIVFCSKEYKDMEQQLLKYWPDADYRSMYYSLVTGVLEEYLYVYKVEQEYLNAIHDDLMKIISEFDKVCRENHLRYYITGGSLIGVVRHHDFIPWDDDIDVTMPLSDFERLKTIVKDKWTGDEFKLLDFDELGAGKFYDFIPRLLYMKAKYPTDNYSKIFCEDNPEILHRAALDIFILNAASDSKLKRMIMENGIRLVYALCMGHRDILSYSEYDRLSHFKIKTLKILNRIGSLIPLKLLFSWYRLLSSMAEKENSLSYFEANLNILYLSTYVKKKYYGQGQDMMIQNLAVRVPDDTNGQLNAKGYKNYMTWPAPKYQRPTHVISQKGVKW